MDEALARGDGLDDLCPLDPRAFEQTGNCPVLRMGEAGSSEQQQGEQQDGHDQDQVVGGSVFGRGSVACNLLRPIVHLRKTVQAVCAKWMTDGYARMLEAARLAHADSLHDRARTLIAERGERDDFR